MAVQYLKIRRTRLCYENEFYLRGKLLEYMCEDGTSRHHALRVSNNNFNCEFQLV